MATPFLQRMFGGKAALGILGAPKNDIKRKFNFKKHFSLRMQFSYIYEPKDGVYVCVLCGKIVNLYLHISKIALPRMVHTHNSYMGAVVCVSRAFMDFC